MPDAAPITFADYCADLALLGPWHGEAWKRDDATAFSSPREAAARATYAATVEHKGKRGLVLVLATEQGLARECRGFLEAFFEQKLLAPLVKRIAPDGIELRGGMVIEVSTNDKRLVRDALCVVELKPASDQPPVEVKPLDLYRLILHVAHTDPDSPTVAAISKIVGLDIVAALREYERRCAEREPAGLYSAPMRAGGAACAHVAVTSVPTVPRTRDEYLASGEFEHLRAERMGLQPEPVRVITGRRR
jgi:hypothetical protein